MISLLIYNLFVATAILLKLLYIGLDDDSASVQFVRACPHAILCKGCGAHPFLEKMNVSHCINDMRRTQLSSSKYVDCWERAFTWVSSNEANGAISTSLFGHPVKFARTLLCPEVLQSLVNFFSLYKDWTLHLWLSFFLC